MTKTGWWFGTFGLCFHILGIIIPTDFHIIQRGGSTTNQKSIVPVYWNYKFHSRILDSV
jgi:hypothetical protein